MGLDNVVDTLACGAVTELESPKRDADREDVEGSTLDLLTKLESTDGVVKAYSAAAIGHILQEEPHTLPILSQPKIVGTLISGLVADDLFVRTECLGALRNLAVTGGEPVCAVILSGRVLDRLVPNVHALVPELNLNEALGSSNEHWKREEARTIEEEKELVAILAENMCSLIQCLCEASEEATAQLTCQPVVALLLSLLFNRGSACALSSVSCLLAMVDCNRAAKRLIEEEKGAVQDALDWLSLFDAFDSLRELRFALSLVALFLQLPSQSSLTLRVAKSVFDACLVPPGNLNGCNPERLSLHLFALETLANLFAPDSRGSGIDSEWQDVDSMDTESVNDIDSLDSAIDWATFVIQSSGILESAFNGTHAAKLRALALLSNVVLAKPESLSALSVATPESILCNSLESSLVALEDKDYALADAHLSLAFSLAQTGVQVASDSLKLIPQLCAKCSTLADVNVNILVKLVNIIAAVGTAAQSPEANAPIGSTLLAILDWGAEQFSVQPVAALEVCSETLDAIFDIYGDESAAYDLPVFHANGYLAILAQFSVKFSTMVHLVSAKENKVVRNRAQGALTNLEAFVAYKSNDYAQRNL